MKNPGQKQFDGKKIILSDINSEYITKSKNFCNC